MAASPDGCLGWSCPDGWGRASPLASGGSSITLLRSRAALPRTRRRQLRRKSLVPCSENIPYTTGTSSGGKDLSTTRVCHLHKLQAALPALPQPARSAPCPQACPSVPAPCCGASAGPRSCCWGQSQLTHSSPGSHGGGTATLPRQSCHLLSRDLPRSLHQGMFPFFFFFNVFIARNTKIPSHKSACHLHFST